MKRNANEPGYRPAPPKKMVMEYEGFKAGDRVTTRVDYDNGTEVIPAKSIIVISRFIEREPDKIDKSKFVAVGFNNQSKIVRLTPKNLIK